MLRLLYWRQRKEATMLRSLNELARYKVTAIDGDVGSVADFLLDDRACPVSDPSPAADAFRTEPPERARAAWAVRYLVVQTGGLFDRRRVLISPISFREVDAAAKRFHLALSVAKIKKSPDLDGARPISRRDEGEYFRYYQYPYYWDYAGLWGMGMLPGMLATSVWREQEQPEETRDDGSLRSARALIGFHVEASDGRVGQVDELLIDDATYEVRYLVVNTGLVHKLRLRPQWAERVNWDERMIYVGMPRQAISDRQDCSAPGATGNEGDSRVAREAAGAATGAVTGAILGSVAGPPGVAAGVVVGGLVTADAEAAQTRELDEEIGINGGDVGAPNLKHPAPKRGTYSGGSVGAERSTGESPAEGPIPPSR
jgi:hypothetical protein